MQASFSLQQEIISVETEKDVLQDAEDCLSLYAGNRYQATESLSKQSIDGRSVVDSCNVIHKLEAQKQLRNGEITPFEAVEKSLNVTENVSTHNQSSQHLDLEQYLRRQAELAQQKRYLKRKSEEITSDSKNSGITSRTTKSAQSQSHYSLTKSNSNRKKMCRGHVTIDKESRSELTERERICHFTSVASKRSGRSTNNVRSGSESEYVPSDDTDDSSKDGSSDAQQSKRRSKRKLSTVNSKNRHPTRILDDGDENIYRDRMRTNNINCSQKSHHVNGLLKIPLSLWNKLYNYQKVAVRWLWELHTRCLGGLLGDEMGLGKTVEVIAFLAALDHSELLSDGERFRGLGPTLIICPATLMEQWVEHFHYWWPSLRVAILHRSGTYNGNLDGLLNSLRPGGVLITTYSGILGHQESLLEMQWHYVILDEGHKIRNPKAKITKTVKEFSTPHRLLLTGSPMQNSLSELWSLFDFVLPGKLGTLPAFLEHCATPITRGGYSNATPLQQATALQVATMLKDAITPYMLRRTKADVKHHLNLPDKNEQVLFCTLTNEQKELYKDYLRSDDVSFVLHESKGNRQGKGTYKARVLVALCALRKICNHPDLFLYGNGDANLALALSKYVCPSEQELNDDNSDDNSDDIDVEKISKKSLENFGHWKRAGKTTVVRSLLRIWKNQGHRVLLFTQGRQMMYILESLLQREQYSYLRMDGTSTMSRRQETIRKFNNDPTYFIFLLTTRVGGLGVNLIGADRVVIYDPDWNPATDCQARERAWRIGQNKNVTVYRLITAGTIEEKIYHRQVFKVLLSNKVLEDPRQSRFIKMSDLTELLHLNEPHDQLSETDQLFPRARLRPTTITTTLSSHKIERMRKLASVLSDRIARKVKGVAPNAVSGDRSLSLRSIETSIDKESESECNTATPRSESNVGTESLSSNLRDNKNHRNQRKRCKTKQRFALTVPQSVNGVEAVFEGERVSCLLGRRIAQKQIDKYSSSSSSPLSRSATDDDNYVLNKLITNAGVKSAFQHEAILSNNVHTADMDEINPTQRMARETARESMNYLKESRQWCKPAWTRTSSTND